jgi:hypothetical protein
MSQAKLSEDLLDELRSLKTAEQVEDFIEQHEQQLEWKFLGGRSNNENVVHIVADPANALTERVTNAIDACLERGVHENNIEDASSPREAVEGLFGLSKAGYNDMSQSWVTSVADANIKVSIEENGKTNRPVIEFRDWGIGQSPDDFESTFLSLNEDSKVTKPYLIGKYGQGGASTFRYCPYAIIISRHCDGGNIGWSIVRYNPRTEGEDEYTTGVYEYCSLPSGEVPTILESEVDNFEGSVVRLVEYDAANFNNSLSPGRGNLYTVFHRTMFGSLFPFMLEDRRVDRFTGYDGPRRRSVVGGRYRLDKPSKYVDSFRDFRRVDLDEHGALRIKYWVLEDRDAVKQFADPTEPIVFTLHGQRHHSEGKRKFKEGTGYNFLKDRIVVEVNCDGLSKAGRRVFTSDREAISGGGQGDFIRQKVFEALDEDDKLEELNDEYKRRAIRETSSDQEERAKDLLADLLQNPKQGDEDEALTEGGNDEQDDEAITEGGEGEEDEGPDNLHDYPTYVEIVNKQEPIPAKQGRTLRVEIEADVDWKFEELERGEITLDLTDVNALTYERETTLEDGRKYIYARVDEDADIGETGVITAVAQWEDGRHENDRTVKITAPPTTSSSSDSGELQSPEITQVTQDNNSLGWDETDVVEFHPDDGDVGRVYVSMFNENIEPILDSLSSEQTAQRRKSAYTGYMSYYEVMRENEIQEENIEVDERYVNREQNRVAKVLMRQLIDGMNPEVI